MLAPTVAVWGREYGLYSLGGAMNVLSVGKLQTTWRGNSHVSFGCHRNLRNWSCDGGFIRFYHVLSLSSLGICFLACLLQVETNRFASARCYFEGFWVKLWCRDEFRVTSFLLGGCCKNLQDVFQLVTMCHPVELCWACRGFRLCSPNATANFGCAAFVWDPGRF